MNKKKNKRIRRKKSPLFRENLIDNVKNSYEINDSNDKDENPDELKIIYQKKMTIKKVLKKKMKINMNNI